MRSLSLWAVRCRKNWRILRSRTCSGPALGLHEGHEAIEEVLGIVGTRRSLGVILHGVCRMGEGFETLNGLVVEVAVRDAHVMGKGGFVRGKSVVVAGDLIFLVA